MLDSEGMFCHWTANKQVKSILESATIFTVCQWMKCFHLQICVLFIICELSAAFICLPYIQYMVLIPWRLFLNGTLPAFEATFK